MPKFIEFNVSSPVKVKVDFVQLLMKNHKRLMMDLVDKMLEESTRNLAEGEHNVSSYLTHSGRTEWDPTEQEAILIYDAPYAAAHEYGSRAHIAPLGPSLNVDIPISKKTGKKLSPKLAKRRVMKGWKPMGLFIKKIIKMVGTPDPKVNPFDYWAWRKGKRKIINCGTFMGRYRGYHTALGWGVWKKVIDQGTNAYPYVRPAIDKVKSMFGFFAKKYGFDVE